MRTKLSNRVYSSLLAVTMAVGLASPAYASDLTTAVVGSITQAIVNSANRQVTATPVTGTIINNGSEICHPYLNDSVDVKKTFSVKTSSSMPSGAVFIYLYRNGNEYSDSWIMGVNDSASWTVSNPPAGEYTLKVEVQGSIAPVTFTAYWEE